MYVSTYQHASYKKIQAIKKGQKGGAKIKKTTATALQLQYYSKFFRKKGAKKNALTTK